MLLCVEEDIDKHTVLSRHLIGGQVGSDVKAPRESQQVPRHRHREGSWSSVIPQVLGFLVYRRGSRGCVFRLEARPTGKPRNRRSPTIGLHAYTCNVSSPPASWYRMSASARAPGRRVGTTQVSQVRG
jgi:hypothetical protein